MLVEEMGGSLAFESEENVGTTFYMRIPIKGMKARVGDVKLTV
jgi:signal transduction histidine kinase